MRDRRHPGFARTSCPEPASSGTQDRRSPQTVRGDTARPPAAPRSKLRSTSYARHDAIVVRHVVSSDGELTPSIETEWQFDAVHLAPVQRWLGQHAEGTIRVEPAGTRSLVDTYLDTSDLRIYRAQRSLRLRRVGRATEITLKAHAPAVAGVRSREEITERLARSGRGRARDRRRGRLAGPGPHRASSTHGALRGPHATPGLHAAERCAACGRGRAGSDGDRHRSTARACTVATGGG